MGVFSIQKHSGVKESISTFAGTEINQTLLLYLKMQSNEDKIDLDDQEATFTAKDLGEHFRQVFAQIPSTEDIENWLIANPLEITSLPIGGKYTKFLPIQLQITMLLSDSLDLPGTNNFIATSLLGEPGGQV